MPSRKRSGLVGLTLAAVMVLVAGCGPDATGPEVTDLVIETSTLPTGSPGVSYSAQLTASGGAAGYVWSVLSGELPEGLALSSSGAITGTPSMTGSSDITVHVESGSQTAERAYTLEITVAAVARPLAVVRSAEVFLVTTTGDDEVKLTNAADVQVEWAGWSPNGEEIAFVGSPAGEFRELWVMNADGSDQRVVSDVPGPVHGPVDWSPGGERLLFVAWSATYVVNRDGSGQVGLTAAEDGADSPTWSPDGEWIAYQGLEDGQAGIFRMRRDGTDSTLLVPLDSFLHGQTVRYAPEGDLIAYDHANDVWVVSEDGSAPTQLTDSPSSGDEKPVWSPDGSHIAFRTDGGARFDIAVMEMASGLIVAQKGHQGIGDADAVEWSPDGTRIVFRIGTNGLAMGPISDSAAWESAGLGTSASWHPGG